MYNYSVKNWLIKEIKLCPNLKPILVLNVRFKLKHTQKSCQLIKWKNV